MFVLHLGDFAFVSHTPRMSLKSAEFVCDFLLFSGSGASTFLALEERRDLFPKTHFVDFDKSNFQKLSTKEV